MAMPSIFFNKCEMTIYLFVCLCPILPNHCNPKWAWSSIVSGWRDKKYPVGCVLPRRYFYPPRPSTERTGLKIDLHCGTNTSLLGSRELSETNTKINSLNTSSFFKKKKNSLDIIIGKKVNIKINCDIYKTVWRTSIYRIRLTFQMVKKRKSSNNFWLIDSMELQLIHD